MNWLWDDKISFWKSLSLESKEKLLGWRKTKFTKKISTFTKNQIVEEKKSNDFNVVKTFFNEKNDKSAISIRRVSLSKRKRSSKILLKEGKSVKSKNYLWIVFFVKKFIEILKTRTIETKIKRMKTYHENIFGDLAFFQTNEIKKDKERLNNPFYKLYVQK